MDTISGLASSGRRVDFTGRRFFPALLCNNVVDVLNASFCLSVRLCLWVKPIVYSELAYVDNVRAIFFVVFQKAYH